MARIGLVLGAGGMVGHAYQAGVLQAIHEVTGWDPRRADVIVGTSAGAHVAALLRAGLSAADVAARVAGEPLSDEGAALAGRIGSSEPMPPPQPRAWAMPAPRLLLRSATRPWTARIGTMAAAALPRGRVPLDAFAARIRWQFGESWPDESLWLCAVRLRDGARVVFGRRGAPVTDVGSAVAASCAVPGWFKPVAIGTDNYVDGGAASFTNLDVVAGLGLDLAIVVAPMSMTGASWRPDAFLPARASLRWLLRMEARRVRRSGTGVMLFQPTGADVTAMGWNAMSTDRGNGVAASAYASARSRLQQADMVGPINVLQA